MTVEELISILQQYPGDTLVFIEDSEYGHPDTPKIKPELMSITEVELPGHQWLKGPHFRYTECIWPEDNYKLVETFDAIVIQEVNNG